MKKKKHLFENFRLNEQNDFGRDVKDNLFTFFYSSVNFLYFNYKNLHKN